MPEAAIKRFLQKKDTGEYYAGPGRWVDNVKYAKRFASLSEASEVVGTDDVPNGCCVVLVRFNGDEYDVKLEV